MAEQDPNAETTTGTDVSANTDSIEGMVDKLIADETPKQDTQQDDDTKVDKTQQRDTRQVDTTRTQSQPQTDKTQQQKAPQRTPLKGMDGLFVDAAGNVTNLAGLPIARSGDERRLLEKAGGPVSKIMGELKDARTQLDLYEKAHSVAKDNGLTPADIMVGHQLAAAWKKDKAKTIQYLLTQAKEEGINIEGIGSTNAVDVPAIAAAVQKAFGQQIEKFVPLLDWWSGENETRLLRQRSDGEVDEFLTSYPDAATHEAAIADVMRASNHTVNMHQAYTILLRFANERRLDWSKPLGPQINGQGRTDQRSRQATASQRDDLPPFGGNDANAGRVAVKSGKPSDSWESLIRDTLAEVQQR